MAYSVPMALVDYVPVLCFLAAAVILQRGRINQKSSLHQES